MLSLSIPLEEAAFLGSGIAKYESIVESNGECRHIEAATPEFCSADHVSGVM